MSTHPQTTRQTDPKPGPGSTFTGAADMLEIAAVRDFLDATAGHDRRDFRRALENRALERGGDFGRAREGAHFFAVHGVEGAGASPTSAADDWRAQARFAVRAA